MVDPESPSHKLIGAVLNARWKLVRLLGEGGMGAVYEGDSVRGEGRCALKLLHPEFANEPSVVTRFFAEAQANQALQHPNITRIFEATRAEDGTPYLVMELLSGLPLSAYIDGGEAMPLEKAVPIIHEVLQALADAHKRRIVHRDLKPENIFLARDANGGTTAKVLDFGIAKVMDVAGGMGNKTRTGALLGTPGYMSPEQVKSSKDVDPRSDLWSVGAMFYELITGGELFPADNDFARLTRVLTDEPPSIEKVAPALAVWGQFFRRALARDPAQRFQTAEEMDQSLMTLARGAPSVAEWSVAPTPRAAVVTHAAPGGSPQASPSPAPAARPSGGGLTVPIAAHPGVSSPSPLPLPALSPSPAPSPSPSYGHGTTLPSAPAAQGPIAVIRPPLAPLAGAPGSSASTLSSAQKPSEAPAFHGIPTPPVKIIEAPPMQKGAPWWVVGVVAFVCLGLGFALGFLAGG